MSKKKSYPCTFCGENMVARVEKISARERVVECGRCRARGPIGVDHREAIDLWKRRPECDFCGGKQDFFSAVGQLVFWGCSSGVMFAIIYIYG